MCQDPVLCPLCPLCLLCPQIPTEQQSAPRALHTACVSDIGWLWGSLGNTRNTGPPEQFDSYSSASDPWEILLYDRVELQDHSGGLASGILERMCYPLAPYARPLCGRNPRQFVRWLCGIGGVSPIGYDERWWGGRIDTAYHIDPEVSYDSVDGIARAMERADTAIRYINNDDLFRNFSIGTWISLHKESIMHLGAVARLTGRPGEPQVQGCSPLDESFDAAKAILESLECFSDLSLSQQARSHGYMLQVIALTVQFLCLSLVLSLEKNGARVYFDCLHEQPRVVTLCGLSREEDALQIVGMPCDAGHEWRFALQWGNDSICVRC